MFPRALLCLFLTVLASASPSHPGRKRKAGAGPKPASQGIVNGRALAPFLASLRALASPGGDRVVRILQFGDSHTAADLWSGRVRRRLQDQFGDAGPGWLSPGRPWRGYPHAGVRFVAGQGWAAKSLRSADCDGLVGLTGTSVLPPPGEAFKVQAAFGAFRVALLGPGGDGLTAQWQTVPPDFTPPTPVAVPQMEAFPLREGLALEVYARKEPSSGQMRELQLALPAGSRLLGVELLTGRPGVVYDELGLNGAELTDLERWNPALRGALLAGTKPDLIVLAYGTNDMGMAVSAQPGYEQRVEKLLQAFRRDSGAPILVVGPLDRLGKRRRQRAALAAGADWIIRTLAQASRETGCAFWDARGAMGGYGAILKWRRAGLAQADLVHLNGAGYQKLGDLMTDALLKILR